MKILINTLLITCISLFSFGVTGATPAKDFGVCLVDNLNGKERKKLAKWIFFGIAAHPEIKKYSRITTEDSVESNIYTGSLITRLLAENCPSEMKSALKEDPMAIENAFKIVGEVAMQELMNNQDVITAITGYIKHTDQVKITELINE